MDLRSEKADAFLTDTLLTAGGSLEENFLAEEENQEAMMYVAGLLEYLLTPGKDERRRHLYCYASDLWQKVDETLGYSQRFQILRVNGDVRLLQPVIVSPHFLSLGPGPSALARCLLSDKYHQSLGRSCYVMAAEYANRSDGLKRFQRPLLILANDFRFFSQIIELVASEYFHLWKRLTDGEAYHLLYDEDFHQANRHFFSCYLRYRAKPTRKNRRHLEQAVDRIHQYQPSFQCPF